METAKNGHENDRDSKGQFAKGWRGGPGRPNKPKNQSFAQRFREDMFSAWKAVDGRKLLQRFAREDPKAYAKLMADVIKIEAATAGKTGKRADGDDGGMSLPRIVGIIQQLADKGQGPLAEESRDSRAITSKPD